LMGAEKLSSEEICDDAWGGFVAAHSKCATTDVGAPSRHTRPVEIPLQIALIRRLLREFGYTEGHNHRAGQE
jgi:hypothetical protein